MMATYPTDEDPIKVPRFEASAGFYTTKQRSRQMARIKSRDSKAELILRKALWARNLRFRLHDNTLPGKPDIVIKKYKLVIFIDGEFWHGRNWEVENKRVKNNRAFWLPKIARNMQRDREINLALREQGFIVFRFWDSEIKKDLASVLNQISLFIESAREVKIPEKDQLG